MSDLQRQSALRARLNRPSERDALIRAYVSQQMGAEQTDDFEILLMADSTLLDDVEAEVGLRQVLQAHPDNNVVALAPKRDAKLNRPHWRNPATWMTLAAGIVVGVVAPSFNGPRTPEFASDAVSVNPLRAVQVATVPATRSTEYDQTPHELVVTAGTASLVVQWAAPLVDQPLRVIAGTTASAPSLPVQADADSGTVSVQIATQHLVSGDSLSLDLQCQTDQSWSRCGRPLLLTTVAAVQRMQ